VVIIIVLRPALLGPLSTWSWTEEDFFVEVLKIIPLFAQQSGFNFFSLDLKRYVAYTSFLYDP